VTESKDAVGEPPPRGSRLSLETIQTGFPDDDALAANIRKIDHYLGMIEQGVLVGLLSIVVLVMAAGALSDKIAGHQFGTWSFTLLRGGTFSVAMFGAVYATHQQRHLAMDLISRRLSPRGRLLLGIALKAFTVGIAALLFRSALHNRTAVGGNADAFISDTTVATSMPIAAALIILHSLLHIVIDVDYFARGKSPPERARAGH
jgi:TRAP-type C4-dicarboxylate transport system permease small subunit